MPVLPRAGVTGDPALRATADAGPDPLAVRSPLVVVLFCAYLRWYMSRHFHALRLSRTGVPRIADGRPVIVFANHPSWWDPTLFILAHRALLRERVGFGPMDAASLARYGVLRRVGVFGVAPGAAGVRAFLRTGLRVLAQPRSALWVTAEGRFTDPRLRPVRLRPGIAHLALRVPDAVLVPLAIEYAFWNESRPEALLRFGRPVEVPGGPLAGRDAAGLTRLLEAELSATMDGLAAESTARDPALFHVLLQGGTGVGGIYDLWRRVRALAAGRRFEPAHEAPRLGASEPGATRAGTPVPDRQGLPAANEAQP